MQEKTDVLFLIDWARELSAEYPFFDFHVHPYDVVAGDTIYQANNIMGGLFSKGTSAYIAPSLKNNELREISNCANVKNINSERALLLGSRCLYVHTGPKVFTDQIDLVGISNVLLLPVVRFPGCTIEMMDNVTKMFSSDDCFHLGCPVPVGMKPDELDAFYRAACNKWGISAIKVHPNLAGMDPLVRTDGEMIETTLEIAGELGLPVIVHGGRTPGLENPEHREYGMICRLKELDWSLSSSAVVIAHAGCYGIDINEARDALSILEKMFERHSNLYADISNLDPPMLELVMGTIDRKRLIFGSDALYAPIWKAWVRFLQTLREVSASPDDDLACIASQNPANCLQFPSGSRVPRKRFTATYRKSHYK